MLLVLLIFGTCALIVSSTLTVNGRAQGYSTRIIENLQRRGLQQSLVERYLAELIQNRDYTGGFRSRVAAKALEILMEREDRTGEVVRELMADPDGLLDRYAVHGIPSGFWADNFVFPLMMGVIMMGIWCLLPLESFYDGLIAGIFFALLQPVFMFWGQLVYSQWNRLQVRSAKPDSGDLSFSSQS